MKLRFHDPHHSLIETQPSPSSSATSSVSFVIDVFLVEVPVKILVPAYLDLFISSVTSAPVTMNVNRFPAEQRHPAQIED